MGSLQQYFALYQFPTGRRLFAMREVAERAARHGLVDIKTLAEQAVEQAQRTAAIEAGWRRSRSTQHGRRKRAGAADAELDRRLGGSGEAAESWRALSERKSKRGSVRVAFSGALSVDALGWQR